MKKPQLPAASRFVDQVRALYETERDLTKRWSAIREAMIPLLSDPALMESAKSWPLTVLKLARKVYVRLKRLIIALPWIWLIVIETMPFLTA